MHETFLFRDSPNVLLLSLHLPENSRSDIDHSIDELHALSYSLGAVVCDELVQQRSEPHPAYFFGKGKLEQIKDLIHLHSISLLITDGQLSPKQAQNLEKSLHRPILDRTQLILEIFGRNARSREAKLQIELAQSEYLLPRLLGMWRHLDRERGGIGVSRGTGEKQIEKDRQILRRRIAHLKEDLKRVDRERSNQRKRRSSCLQVSLVGYTNAGKSTIMNTLTHSDLLVENKLFATLDSTTRLLEEDSRPKILLSDTVGFIRNLPHELVASFHSTLETIRDADLLLHVLDVGAEFEQHINTTLGVLDDIEAVGIPKILVFNKIDQLNPIEKAVLRRNYPEAVFVSAANGQVSDLQEAIIHFFERRMETVQVQLSYQHSRRLAKIYEWSRVNKIDYRDDGIFLELTAIPSNLQYLRHHLPEAQFEQVELTLPN
jgi:GTP-binding protein HflX